MAGEYISPAELAPLLGVSKATVRRWVRLGCPHRTEGLRRVLVNKEEVEAWMATVEGPLATPVEPKAIEALKEVLDGLGKMLAKEPNVKAKAAYQEASKLVMKSLERGRKK